MSKLQYIDWFKLKDDKLTTKDGLEIEQWEFNYEENEQIMSEWAKHFRNMYCNDSEIDTLKNPLQTRKEFLLDIKFPDNGQGGAKIRSGDFAELLVADLLEYLERYWVPRTRYDRKIRRNTSTFGCDVIALKQIDYSKPSISDEILVVEVKAQFNQRNNVSILPRLQDAVEDSKEDPIRRSESLQGMKTRLKDRGETELVKRLERFQLISQYPCKERYGAAACFTNDKFDEVNISETDCSDYQNKEWLRLLVIKGKNMMDLVNSLYERAANEA